MAGLNKNRKPVAGLTTKNCQLISGRGSLPRHAQSQPKWQSKECNCQRTV